MALPVNWVAEGAADTTGDGIAEILLRNTVTGEVALWFMSGATVMSGSLTTLSLPDTQWRIGN